MPSAAESAALGGAQTPLRSSVELASWPVRRVALTCFGLSRFFGKITALFGASNAPMRPQAFQNHFCGSRGGAHVLAIVHAQFADLIHEALNFRQLLVSLRCGCKVRQL